MFEGSSLRVAKKFAPFSSPEVGSLEVESFSKILIDCQISKDLALLNNATINIREAILKEAGVSNDSLISFPISIQRNKIERLKAISVLDDVDLFLNSLSVSSNYFRSLLDIDIVGSAYSQSQKDKEKPNELFPNIFNVKQKNGKKLYPKAYVKRDKKAKKPDKILSIWDLIYPMLLPPVNLEFTPKADLPHPLYEFQKVGINFLLSRKEALLADEMGTGKTVMSVVGMRILLRQGKIRNLLIVCPVSILGVWIDHLEEWAPDLQLTVVRGPHDYRCIDWSCPAHVYLTTYDTLKYDVLGNGKYGPAFKKEDLQKFDLVLIDEAQNIKVPTSDRSRAIKKLKPRYRWALSGTPLENRIEDLVSVFDFIKPGLFKSESAMQLSVKKTIAPYFLRRRKKDVMKDLPSKVRQEMWLELDKEQRKIYDKVEKEGRQKLESLGDKVTKPHIFSLITKLKQICNFTPGKTSSPKTEALLDLVQEITDNDQKALIFSYYKKEGIDKLEKTLSKYGAVRFCGDMNDKKRRQALEDFKKDPFKSLFLGQVRTAGLGLNLTEASYVIHFDHWWNPAVMWQAEDRAHRHGQKNKVNIYNFWMRNTIEERIHKKLKEKGLLFQDVIEGLAEKNIDKLMSNDDWYEILGIKVKSQKKVITKTADTDTNKLTISGTLNQLQNMDPLDFEKIICHLFVKFGFNKAKVTKKSHDGGIDIAALRWTIGGEERVIVQCKRKIDAVGVEHARELLGVLESDSSLSKGYLITSGSISEECKSFCKRNGKLAYLDGVSVAKYINEFKIQDLDSQEPKSSKQGGL